MLRRLKEKRITDFVIDTLHEAALCDHIALIQKEES
jgi:hypothetical protein